MAIDTKVQVTLKNHTSVKDMRRRGSPEPSCQLPTAPAHYPTYERTPNNCSQIVYQAKRHNLISKPDKCEVCNTVEQLVAHHPLYSYPLDVVWLCRVCHGKLHLGNVMVQMTDECPPEMFESDNEKIVALETAWQESTHVISNEIYIKGTFKTAII